MLMSKILMGFGVVVASLALCVMGMFMHTKSFSPHKTAQIDSEQIKMKVEYHAPFKKEREIFGGVVKFGEVWRTGANEATTFYVDKSLKIYDHLLQPGTYSVWTVPEHDRWTVIFNHEYGQWGIDLLSGKANRDVSNDVLKVQVPVYKTHKRFEQFNIQLEHIQDRIDMVFFWDDTMVVLPFEQQ